VIDRLLAQLTESLGRPVPVEWERALRAVPRHLFLPDRLWLRDGDGGYALCDRAREPGRWRDAAYTDAPLVTQLATEGGLQVPTSSASAPSTVLRMLEQAEIEDGMRVLEIGTGTGFHAALLAARLGGDRVVSVEIDPGLAEEARGRLARAGFGPAVECGDGARGWAAGGPYHRVIATCSVRAVPPAWLEQTRAGGRIVTPWDSAWCCYGTLVLAKDADGGASGRFAPYGSYMTMRGQRPDVELSRDVLREGQVADLSVTGLSPWAVAGHDLDAQFAVGLAVPGVWHSWATGVAGVHTRLWLADDAASSWAAVDYDGEQTAAFAVSQFGPRRLWDEVAGAHRRWVAAGGPGVDRYGLAVSTPGSGPRSDRIGSGRVVCCDAGSRTSPAP